MLFFKKKKKQDKQVKTTEKHAQTKSSDLKILKQKKTDSQQSKKNIQTKKSNISVKKNKNIKTSSLPSTKKHNVKQKDKLIKSATGLAYLSLIRPIITEKAMSLQEQGVYTFETSPNANKIMIKKAIKELYGLNPVKVNIIKLKGKIKRYGKSIGKTKQRKKALVYLKKGEKIEFSKK